MTSLRIPKLFHWIWFGSQPLPEQHQRWIEGWLARHPGWEHRLWTDANRPTFTNEAQFLAAETYAQKADIARYEILYRCGGVYLDTDMECLRCIEPLLEGVEAFIAAEEPDSLEDLGTAILGATAGHPWLAELIARLPEAMETRFGIRRQTGPLFATSVTLGHPAVTVFPERLFCHIGQTLPEATCAVHHGPQRWVDTSDETKLRQLVSEDLEPVVPQGALFILVDKGRGLEISGGRRSVPFPEQDGVWAGYPADDAAAIAELERLRHVGAEFMVFPAPMLYWLDHYTGLRDHLRTTACCVVENDRSVIFALHPATPRAPFPVDAGPSPSIAVPKRESRVTRNRAVPVAEQLRTLCLFLGPYRNLTTLTASMLHLHPTCQVLNHAGDRVLDTESLNFLVDYTDAKFVQFCEFALSASAGGRREDYGGSITLSHAFDYSEMREAYRRRYGYRLVKPRVNCIVWKESLLVSHLLQERQVDISALLRKNTRICFLMPVRNPLDCAVSNLRTGHAARLRSGNGQDVKDVLEAILGELAWFRGLSRQHTDRFFSFFEFEFDEPLLESLCQFLQLERDKRWTQDALQCFRLKPPYEHDVALIQYYQSLVQQRFAGDAEFAEKLERFVPAMR